MNFILDNGNETWENTPQEIREKIQRDLTQADIESEMELLN